MNIPVSRVEVRVVDIQTVGACMNEHSSVTCGSTCVSHPDCK